MTIITDVAYDLLVKELVELIKTKADSNHTQSATTVIETDDKKFVTNTQIQDWNNKVTQSQLEQAVKQFASGLSWKGVYETMESLRASVTDPKEGDFVIVTKEPSYSNKNTMLIYEAESVNDWQKAGDLFTPNIATQTEDGLMSKDDKKKLDGLNNYTLPVANSSVLGGVKQGANITISEDGTISTHAPYTHPANHPASIITEDSTHRFVTDDEKTKWNKASTDATESLSTANTAKSTADSALQKATTNESTLNNTMTEEEAQSIIDKYKGVTA